MMRIRDQAYPDRVLAYVDILGWTDLIKRAVSKPHLHRRIGRAIAQIQMCANEVGKIYPGGFQYEATHFSDTLVMSCAPTGAEVRKLLHVVQLFCRELLTEGHYTRGAIVRGLLHHDHMVIHGPALIEAHQIERDVAKYPRVIVTRDVRRLFETLIRRRRMTRTTMPRLRSDHDGLHFVDLFAPMPPAGEALDWLGQMKRAVRGRLKRNRNNMNWSSKDAWVLSHLERVETVWAQWLRDARAA